MSTYIRTERAELWSWFGTTPTDPTLLTISIYDPDGVLIIGPTSMTFVETALYKYEFDIPDSWVWKHTQQYMTEYLSGNTFRRVETFNVVAEETLVASALPTGTYCTLGDVRQELVGVGEIDKLSDINSIITDKIYMETEAINARTNNIFNEITATEMLDGNGTGLLVLPRRPVTSVSIVRIRIVIEFDWVVFNTFGYVNVIDRWGNNVRTPSTDDEVRAAYMIVDCNQPGTGYSYTNYRPLP